MSTAWANSRLWLFVLHSSDLRERTMTTLAGSASNSSSSSGTVALHPGTARDSHRDHGSGSAWCRLQATLADIIRATARYDHSDGACVSRLVHLSARLWHWLSSPPRDHTWIERKPADHRTATMSADNSSDSEYTRCASRTRHVAVRARVVIVVTDDELASVTALVWG